MSTLTYSKEYGHDILPESLWLGADYYQNASHYGGEITHTQWRSAKQIAKYVYGAHADIGSNNGALTQITEGHGIDIGNSITNYENLDTITILHTLEHIPDAEQTIKDIYKALNTHGRVIVEVPNADSFLARKHGEAWKYVAREHIHYFTPESLTALLERNGFTVKKIFTRNNYIPEFSFKYIMQYFFPTERVRDSFKLKSNGKREHTYTYHPVKWVLEKIIHLLGRDDFMVVIAEK